MVFCPGFGEPNFFLILRLEKVLFFNIKNCNLFSSPGLLEEFFLFFRDHFFQLGENQCGSTQHKDKKIHD
jgi:hypothetical protein